MMYIQKTSNIVRHARLSYKS